MKISLGMKGATEIAPDYSMPKAALVAAQAATPTARANGPRPVLPDQHAALHALFASDSELQASAEALGHRFNKEAPEPEDGA